MLEACCILLDINIILSIYGINIWPASIYLKQLQHVWLI